MAKKKVLITVKTYPVVSIKYRELVCTAGFLEDGSMIRLYPVPFRKLPYEKWYQKFDWIELDIVRNTTDFRPESYRPTNPMEIKIVDSIPARGHWEARRKIVLGNVYNNFEVLLTACKDKQKKTSLAVFKPTQIKDFTFEPTEREWNADQKAVMQQLNLFEKVKEGQQLIKKLPYIFRYKFTDITGKVREIMIEDWEVGALFWKMVKKYKGNEARAIEDVKKKFLDDLARKKDLYFFVGTSLEFQAKNAPNPFLIIGVFYPPVKNQLELPGV
ncbi:MAG: hypothetical protein GX589_02340 [Deltaproteobacteria bacterium]|nr:hypothetical protein [Deltaproteobacteria bacterium]